VRQKGFTPVVVMIIVLIFMASIYYFVTANKINVGLSPTPSPSVALEIRKHLSYVVPVGWSEVGNKSDFQYVHLISPDYTSDAIPFIQSGAEIYMDISNYDLSDVSGGGTNVYSNSVNINGNKWLNKFFCWEGCQDEYHLSKKSYYIRVRFICAPDCETKDDINSSKYSQVRDSFLQSLKID